VSWEFTKGPIPSGLHVWHKFENTRCVNPSHLFLGTPADNQRDKTEKGRTPSGETHYKTFLTNRAILDIRKLALRGVARTQLAAMYSLRIGHIGQIVRREVWKHI
jgi:hypothetical protein